MHFGHSVRLWALQRGPKQAGTLRVSFSGVTFASLYMPSLPSNTRAAPCGTRHASLLSETTRKLTRIPSAVLAVSSRPHRSAFQRTTNHSGGLGDICEGPEGPDDSLCAGNLGCSPGARSGRKSAVCGGTGSECLYTGSYVPGSVPNHLACLSGKSLLPV